MDIQSIYDLDIKTYCYLLQIANLRNEENKKVANEASVKMPSIKTPKFK